MNYITKETVEKLKSVGFSYPDYAHMENQGMVFWHEGVEYIVGGYCDRELSEEAKTAVGEGLWLPDEQQLMQWLQYNAFDVTVQWSHAEWYCHIRAMDCENQTTYEASGPDLVDALVKLIYKICKSNKRSYLPEERLSLKIDF